MARRLFVYLVTGGISVVLAMLLVEVALRVGGIGFPLFYQPDAHLGSVLRPGVQDWFRSEGRSWVAINGDGMRDREHQIRKPAGTFRIAVLGDSMSEALQVPMERNFSAVLQNRLQGCPALGGKQTEALNFGVSGYGTAQELIMLQQRAWKYEPDLVLLAMFPGNDIRNNSAALNHEPSAPYYLLREGKLELAYPPTGPPENVLRRTRDVILDHSRLLQTIYQIRKNLRTRGADRMVSRDRDPTVYGEQGVDNATFAPPSGDDWRSAWQVTEMLLKSVRDETRAHGASLLVALIPSGIQDNPDGAVREAFMRRLGVHNLSYAHDRLAAFARQEGIPVIPLEAPLRGYAESRHAVLHGFPNGVMGFGHLNENGHQAAGEILAARICEHP
jgi:lysophospholipase L1-like esterase